MGYGATQDMRSTPTGSEFRGMESFWILSYSYNRDSEPTVGWRL